MKKKQWTGTAVVVLILAIAGISLFGGKKGDNNSAKESGMEHLTLDSFKEKVCECGIGGSGSNAEWKYKGDLPAVIDFYADWCGPCKMVGPVLEELSKEYEGRVNIYKIDTEDQQQLAAMFGIRSIPSILFIPLEGQPTMAAGALPKKEFVRIFREVLGVEEAVVSLK
ncbi:MAG: thioredoxin [Chitinispirillaceae bacterium]|nr:thioredoxin [Chitinispirillaceae bacterium]